MSSLVFPGFIFRSLKPVRTVLFYLNYQLETKRLSRLFLFGYSVVRDRFELCGSWLYYTLREISAC